MIGRDMMNSNAATSRTDGEPVLVAQGLTKEFSVGPTLVRAVDDVDLVIHRGEIVLLMGPSGSGKTTLLTLIGGLLRPTSGSVRIGGREITSMNESELNEVRRHVVGFIFQVFNLLEPLSVLENVVIPLNLAGANGREANLRASSVLHDVGLGDRLDFKPDSLSGGEKQRVSIARALVHEPKLILADEPTANLDAKNGHDVVVLLRDIAKTTGRTVIIVSHDQRIREIADRVLRLEDGKLSPETRS